MGRACAAQSGRIPGPAKVNVEGTPACTIFSQDSNEDEAHAQSDSSSGGGGVMDGRGGGGRGVSISRDQTLLRRMNFPE